MQNFETVLVLEFVTACLPEFEQFTSDLMCFLAYLMNECIKLLFYKYSWIPIVDP